MNILDLENSKYSKEKQTISKNVFSLWLGYVILFHIIELVSVWRQKKRREIWMGKPTLAGAVPLVLRNEKQKLKKKREKKESENLFFQIYIRRGVDYGEV